MRPILDKVVLKRAESEDSTPGGLVLPDNAKEKPQKGLVVAVGPGPRNETGEYSPMEMKEGDTVYFNKYVGNEITIAGEKYMVVAEKDILLVV